MKTLSSKFMSVQNTFRKYHLSYDTINCDDDFDGDYNEARRYILCVLANSRTIEINRYCETTLLLTYTSIQPRLFTYLRENLDKYFYYSISLVAKDSTNNHHFISHNPNMVLNTHLQREINDLYCDDFSKKITQY